MPGRRRGDEYREAEKRTADGGPIVEDDPIEDWIARADQVPAALSAVIATKIGKRYAGRASLLVYLNVNEFGIRQVEIEAAMAPAVAPALPCFQRVWLLVESDSTDHGPPDLLILIKPVIKNKEGIVHGLYWHPQVREG